MAELVQQIPLARQVAGSNGTCWPPVLVAKGTQPPTADWGTMLADGRQFITVAAHVAAIPGLAIFVLVLGCNLLGDGLRDALDPRLR